MITVFATREGLKGEKTASGFIIDDHVPFVALPSTLALKQWVRLINPTNGRFATAIVLDVGPWNTKDHRYVFQKHTRPFGWGLPTTPKQYLKAYIGIEAAKTMGLRPRAEFEDDEFGRKTNKAGIDLGEFVWAELGMTDNGYILWEFV